MAGSLLLLATMIFALARFGSADQWIALWVPFVVAGVGLVVVGAIINRGGPRHRSR